MICYMCLFYKIKMSKITVLKTLRGAHHVSLPEMPLRCSRPHESLFF